MITKMKYLFCVILSAALLAGCSIQTVDQMYQLPKRSEDYSNLQSELDKAMVNLDFCAPLAGDNQQSVQIADVDGDDEQEYLVFTKGNADLPLRILVFDRINGAFSHVDTIESNGSAFDQVEYAQMDEKPGLEMIVGRQVSDQLVRSVSVYTFSSGEAEQLVTVNYRKYVPVDLNDDGYMELFVLRPGQTETDMGIAEFYSMKAGVMERSNELLTSGPADKLKRILVGKLSDKKTAVYVASSIADTSLITDVYTLVEGRLVNVTQVGGSGDSIYTMRNYHVYADDMDNDGVVELPSLITMVPLDSTSSSARNDLILWYAMGSDGTIVNKLYTYYDSVGGWYLELDDTLAPKITVNCSANVFDFYLWNENYSGAQKLLTIYVLTGQNREEQSFTDGRFVLLGTDTVTYAASVDAAAAQYQITQESVLRSFYLIHRDWNTGEM